ncbi:terpene cyclase/mutase family protein [Actinomadura oligospora]|uniref:terpene cyclase/mutase family protein n=1 Tax=Actinomadura oligospora TaxID=111804 RepID=UPI00047C1D49|nr:terpene cyclase/mutase family protein [Actinomadura oligospora]
MSIDLNKAADFMARNARILDRRRFDFLCSERGDVEAVIAALEGYRNPDGGYGWGLEPDLRSPESQTGAAAHAFEVFAEVGGHPHAVQLCDWLDSVSLPDGGVPFALPVTSQAGNAPWWSTADTTVSSLQITAITLVAARRVAEVDPGVAEHPWLERATNYCVGSVAALDGPPHAYILAFAVRAMDALQDVHPQAPELLEGLAAHVPDDGRVQVEGGTEDEYLHPLDFAAVPGRPPRDLFSPEIVAADLARLEAGQQEDGGWTVEYAKISPAGALEWRGYETVRVLCALRAAGVLTS